MPKEMISHRAHFETVVAHLAVEPHEQERVASHVLVDVFEFNLASEEHGERHCGAAGRLPCVEGSQRASVCEAHVDDDLADA